MFTPPLARHGSASPGMSSSCLQIRPLRQVLEHWKAGGHKALVFTQTQQMLDIMERSVQNAGMAYHRMDGSTNVANRARLVDDFNDNPAIFVFLLTTKVGGVGINLTGADRYAPFSG